jgi:hypothetical protein
MNILHFANTWGYPGFLVGSMVLIVFVFVFCVVFIRPVSCVPNVASFSEFSIIDCVFYHSYSTYGYSARCACNLTLECLSIL